MRPASTSALMSRSESNMAGHYRGMQPLAAASDFQPVIADRDDCAFPDPDHLASLAARRHAVSRGHGRAVRRSAVDDVNPAGVYTDCQMGLGDRPSLVGDLDQLRILFTGLRLWVATQQDQSVQGDP